MKPFFTIIIPALNEEKHLPDLLNDLKNQTYKKFILIIVDGHSDDRTVEVAEQFKADFPEFEIINSEKRHVAYQRNLGAKLAKTDWIIFLDADNRLPPYFLQGIKYRVETTRPDFLTTWIKPDTENTKDQAFATIANLFHEVQKNTNNPYMLEAMVCCKRKSFLELDGFNDSLDWGEGSDLIRRAVRKKYSYEVVRDPKYTYSLRRLRKQGTLKSVRNIAFIELARLRKREFPREMASYLYPMEGGAYFDKFDEKSALRLKNIVKKIYNNTPLSKVKEKTNLLSRIFEKKAKGLFD